MEKRARLLGSFVQGTLEAIENYDGALGARVREALAPETREAIDRASRVALVPVELDLEVTERLYDLAGDERARAILRANLTATLQSPLLRSFMQMALRLRGNDPGRLFDWSSKVWNQIYRDCGDMEYIRLGESEGRIELHDLPEVLTAHPRYLDGVAATLNAVFSIANVHGHGELMAVDPGTGRAIISVTWEPAD
jgi:hypothetical protein